MDTLTHDATLVDTRGMAIIRLHPERLYRTAGYAHVTLVDAGRLAVLSGQSPLDHHESLVGRGDVLGQVDQIAANATEALAAAGTSADHVIRSVIYVVSKDPLCMVTGSEGRSVNLPIVTAGGSACGDHLVRVELSG